MINNLFEQRKLKKIFLILSIGLLAFQIGRLVPDMLTLSLGSWMYMTFSIVPFIALVTIIAIWNPSVGKLHAPIIRLAPSSVKHLMFICTTALLLGFVTFWIVSNFPVFIITGQVILFGSMIWMFVFGMIKPELGPAMFFAIYPFVMFSQARLFDWERDFLPWLHPNIPEWFQDILFKSEYINVVLLMFTIGFLFFLIRYGKQIGKTILDTPIILFQMWTLISVITANNVSVGVRMYLINWIFPVCIYYATLFAINRPNGIREIKLAFVVLLFVSCLLTIQHAVLEKEIVIGYGERAKIWAVIAGQMGPWTVLILPLAVSILFDRKELAFTRGFSLLTIFLSLIMAVWEMQRVVFVGFAFMLFLNSLLYHRKWRWHLVLYAVLGITFYFAFDKIMQVIDLLRPSLAYVNPFTFSANLDRLYLWQEGLDIAKDNLFLGIGPGGFSLLRVGMHFPEVSTHNFYLDVWVESGVIAAILCAIIIFIPIVNFFISFLKDDHRGYEHDLRPWVISLTTYVCVHLMLHGNWPWGYGVAVFCMLGVIVGTTKKVQSKAEGPKRRPLKTL